MQETDSGWTFLFLNLKEETALRMKYSLDSEKKFFLAWNLVLQIKNFLSLFYDLSS